LAAANKPIEMVSQVAPASGKLLIGQPRCGIADPQRP
jgi:hypothetical protein